MIFGLFLGSHFSINHSLFINNNLNIVPQNPTSPLKNTFKAKWKYSIRREKDGTQIPSPFFKKICGLISKLKQTP